MTTSTQLVGLLVCILILHAFAGVIPNEKHDAQKTTINKTTKLVALTTKATEPPKVIPKITTPPIHKAVNEKPKSHNDPTLQAGPIKHEDKPKPVQVEPSSSAPHVFLFILVLLILGCVAYTYRKKLMGYFIRRGGTTRRGGNVRYRRLSTGEAAIE